MSELSRLEIISTDENAELLGAALAMNVSQGWEEFDAPNGGLLALVYSKSPEYCTELSLKLHEICPAWQCSISTVPEEDWVTTWKEFFTPVEAGSRFLVLAPWMEKEKAETSRDVIIIEPKTAFGTGHHATTALCLTALSNLADAGRIKAGQRFLDLGTGSGILGIGAAKLGLNGIGLDVDLQAVDNAIENKCINDIPPGAFEVQRGSLEAAGNGKFDLILANILAEPLINLASAVAGRLEQGGALVLSGILATQADDVIAAYRAAGMGEPKVEQKEDWVSITWS